MTTQEMTPEKSIKLISQVINEAKSKFEENGAMYIMWGVLVALASLAQFALLKHEYYSISYYPYFLLPLGAIVCLIYYYKKEKAKTNQISTIISVVWTIVGLNIMILGFLFGYHLKTFLIPFILLLLGIGYVITGRAIRSKLIIFSGILINISGFVCFTLEWINHSLLMGIVSLLFVLIPGIVLKINYNKRNV